MDVTLQLKAELAGIVQKLQAGKMSALAQKALLAKLRGEDETIRKQWTLSALATETGMERRTLQKYLAEVPPCATNERDRMWHLKQLTDVLRGSGESDTAKRQQSASLRQSEADADNAEIARDESLGKLLNGEQVFTAWEEIITPAKQKFQGLPSKLASSAGLNQKQVAKLEQEIHDICEELSREPNYKSKPTETKEQDLN